MRYHFFVFLLLIAFILGCSTGVKNRTQRQLQNLDFDWRFMKADLENAQQMDFDDSDWQKINLPHDYSIDGPIQKENPSVEPGGFFPGGIAWYRKSLRLSEEQRGKTIYLQFDGIYRNSDVWVNGQFAGHRFYGYGTHYYDITPYIKFDTDNIIAVRVDTREQPNDRWYPGSGIYRHVWLHIVNPVHIPLWGTYITTPMIDASAAQVKIVTSIKNQNETPVDCKVLTRILNANGVPVQQTETTVNVAVGEPIKVQQDLSINSPNLWSTEEPYLYTAVSQVWQNDKLVDIYKTPFGIRHVVFSPDSGLILNGKKVIMKGVCLHHDGGAVGAAVPDRVWERRLEILKEMGVNAVRLAHNPHAPEVLDMCDRLGILVFDEMYDKWVIPANNQKVAPENSFDATWQQDLTDFIDRDKNHPSVMLWSVGNEVIEQLDNPKEAVRLLKMLVAHVHQQEPSRLVTYALHPANEKDGHEVPSSMIHEMDVVSYNYRTQFFEKWHAQFPDYRFIASETKAYRTDTPQDFSKIDFSNNSWFFMKDFTAGQFIWAGIDYLGESRGWPDKGIRSGIIYTTGFRKPHSWFTESLYQTKPMVQISVVDDSLVQELTNSRTWQISWYGPPVDNHWTFPGKEGRSIEVLTFTNCEAVELILNNKSLGEKRLRDFSDRVIRWQVAYEPGEIIAIGKNKGQEVTRNILKTEGKAHHLNLIADRTTIQADGKDVAHIEVRVVDEQGTIIHNARKKVQFTLEGEGTIIGVDNGDLADHTNYRTPERETLAGRCLVLVQSTQKSGKIILRAVAPGFDDAKITLQTK
ncbi:DUF4982 domain-containing protein [candidate division KSB1 bacterium]|nr:DUF4982 domain-containing protein [candidate division KSB1 bacterium]